MKHWYSDLYANVDAMRLDQFVANLAPDVEVVVGNNPTIMAGRLPRTASLTFGPRSAGSNITFSTSRKAKGSRSWKRMSSTCAKTASPSAFLRSLCWSDAVT